MPSPIWNGCVSLPYTPSSCCQITRSIGVAPRPPYSLGQCRQAQPASAFFFCQALPTSTISSFCSLIRPSEDFESSASNCFGALASIHWRASARNAASWGVSSKFILLSPHLWNVPRTLRNAKRCAAEPGSIKLVPALRSSVKNAAPRPGHELSPGRYLVERNILVDP